MEMGGFVGCPAPPASGSGDPGRLRHAGAGLVAPLLAPLPSRAPEPPAALEPDGEPGEVARGHHGRGHGQQDRPEVEGPEADEADPPADDDPVAEVHRDRPPAPALDDGEMPVDPGPPP